jgi:hypothetical protein
MMRSPTRLAMLATTAAIAVASFATFASTAVAADVQPPSVPVVVVPAVVKGSTVISATSTDDSGLPPALYWSVDGIAQGFASNWITLGTGLADGVHSVSVYAKDGANNVSTPASGPVTLDNTSPAIAINSGPTEGSSGEATAASFGFSVTDPHLSAVTCALDAAAAGACTAADRFDVAGLSLGAHKITISAVDGVGNTASLVRNFTVAAPTIGTPPGSGSTGDGGQTGTPGGAGALQPSDALIDFNWRIKKRKTTVRKLVVSDIRPGAVVIVRCKGGGCAFRKKSVAEVGGKANLLKLFKKKALSAKSRVTVTVSAEGFTSRTFTFTTRANMYPKYVVS